MKRIVARDGGSVDWDRQQDSLDCRTRRKLMVLAPPDAWGDPSFVRAMRDTYLPKKRRHLMGEGYWKRRKV